MTALGLTFITSFIIAFASLPSTIRFARQVNIYDEPGERKLHSRRVPLLGGLSIFAATMFAFTLWSAPFFQASDLFMIAALIILFFLGLRDDMMPLQPLVKIFGQAVAALLVVLFCDVRLYGLHGLFGIYTLPFWAQISISILTILFLVNSYNLIDGIDGLAAGLGIIASIAFAILFFLYHDMFMAVLAVALCGALLGFIPYNFSPARTFMGDTGTMTVGFILSNFAIRFTEISRTIEVQGLFSYHAAPVIVLAILIIPVADTLRVFMVRIIKGRSPFSADRNHIHHKLLQLGLSPGFAALILYALNILFIWAAYTLRAFNPTHVFYFLMISAFALTQLPGLIQKYLSRNFSTGAAGKQNGH